MFWLPGTFFFKNKTLMKGLFPHVSNSRLCSQRLIDLQMKAVLYSSFYFNFCGGTPTYIHTGFCNYLHVIT